MSQQQSLTFSFKEITNQNVGASDQFSFSQELEFPDFQVTSPLQADITLMKLKEGISVQIDNLNLSVKLNCPRSNKPYQQKITIESIQRIFYFHPPEEQFDPFDIYLVDRKRLNLDIYELLRQEIILHLSVDPVCFTSKKDICQYCGFDLSSLKPLNSAEENTNKPLSILKDLINNHAKTSSTKEENR